VKFKTQACVEAIKKWNELKDLYLMRQLHRIEKNMKSGLVWIACLHRVMEIIQFYWTITSFNILSGQVKTKTLEYIVSSSITKNSK